MESWVSSGKEVTLKFKVDHLATIIRDLKTAKNMSKETKAFIARATSIIKEWTE